MRLSGIRALLSTVPMLGGAASSPRESCALLQNIYADLPYDSPRSQNYEGSFSIQMRKIKRKYVCLEMCPTMTVVSLTELLNFQFKNNESIYLSEMGLDSSFVNSPEKKEFLYRIPE